MPDRAALASTSGIARPSRLLSMSGDASSSKPLEEAGTHHSRDATTARSGAAYAAPLGSADELRIRGPRRRITRHPLGGGARDAPVSVAEPVAADFDHRSLGEPIRGPRALTDDWSRFWHLTYNIARNEFKLRFFGSALGYFWQLMRPFLLFGVLYIFFTQVAEVNRSGGPGSEFYGSAATRVDRAVHLFRRSDRGSGAQRRRSGEPRTEDPVPAYGDTARGRPAGLVQPGAKPDRGADLRADRRRDADGQLAGASA